MTGSTIFGNDGLPQKQKRKILGINKSLEQTPLFFAKVKFIPKIFKASIFIVLK
jgi:hypothetical protein